MGNYELLYIVHPDLEASIDKITGKVKDAIEGRKGKITYEENWGKRKLAYEIRKSEVGIYVLWYFEAPADAIAKIERDIRLTEEIIRYMLLSVDQKPKAAKKATKKLASSGAEKAEVKEESGKTKTTEAKRSELKAKSSTAKAGAVKTPAVEDEAERMKKLNEKLGELLGDEEEKSDKK